MVFPWTLGQMMAQAMNNWQAVSKTNDEIFIRVVIGQQVSKS